MFLKFLLNFKTFNGNNTPRLAHCDARKRMFCEACNGQLFYFLASLMKNLLVKTVFDSYYSKLSLSMFLNILPCYFSLMLPMDMFLIKKSVYHIPIYDCLVTVLLVLHAFVTLDKY